MSNRRPKKITSRGNFGYTVAINYLHRKTRQRAPAPKCRATLCALNVWRVCCVCAKDPILKKNWNLLPPLSPPRPRTGGLFPPIPPHRVVCGQMQLRIAAGAKNWTLLLHPTRPEIGSNPGQNFPPPSSLNKIHLPRKLLLKSFTLWDEDRSNVRVLNNLKDRDQGACHIVYTLFGASPLLCICRVVISLMLLLYCCCCRCVCVTLRPPLSCCHHSFPKFLYQPLAGL